MSIENTVSLAVGLSVFSAILGGYALITTHSLRRLVLKRLAQT